MSSCMRLDPRIEIGISERRPRRHSSTAPNGGQRQSDEAARKPMKPKKERRVQAPHTIARLSVEEMELDAAVHRVRDEYAHALEHVVGKFDFCAQAHSPDRGECAAQVAASVAARSCAVFWKASELDGAAAKPPKGPKDPSPSARAATPTPTVQIALRVRGRSRVTPHPTLSPPCGRGSLARQRQAVRAV